MARKKTIALCALGLAIAAAVAAVGANARALFDAATALGASIAVAMDKPLVTPPPGSPLRVDAEPIPFKIGGRYFVIPANVLDSPPEGGREGSFYVDDGALLLFAWPTMEGRTRENWKELGHPIAGGWKGVRVLVYRRIKPGDSSEFLMERFRYRVRSPGTVLECENPLDESRCPELYQGADDLIGHLPDIGGFKHFERYDRHSRDPNFMSDIYLQIDGGKLSSFYVCNRPIGVRKGKGCTVYFADDDYSYDAHFNFERIPMPDWYLVRGAVIRRMDQFAHDGDAFRTTVPPSQ